MKIERLNQDKIRIFLTFDDLHERGIQRDDMWRELPKMHELFSEMMDQAYSEVGFDASGPLAVEVFALPAQGMVVIVTKGHQSSNRDTDQLEDEDEDEFEEGVYELEVTLEASDVVLYAFADIEDVIDACKQLEQAGFSDGGRLYSYNDKYLLSFDQSGYEDLQIQALIAILAEYGNASSVTTAVLEEYGNLIVPARAVDIMCNYF